MYHGKFVAEGIVYPTDAKVDVLFGNQLATKIGIYVGGVSPMLPGDIDKCDDKKWTLGAPMVEEQWGSEIADKVTKAVQGVLSENLELPKSTFCNVANTEFKIKLKGDVVPKFVRQYPVPEALIPQVVSRIEEWMENDWTEVVKV